MTPFGSSDSSNSPIDQLLFDAVQAHSLRTRGRRAKRVTVECDDGSSYSEPLPVRDPEPGAQVAGCGPCAWPPDEGWAFRPGEAAFNGTRFKVAGKLHAILRELARVPGAPVTGDRFKREVWGEDPDLIEDGNLQGHVSQLRKKLRDALGLDRGFDPIPHADGAYRLTVY
jgi:DNA-binding response OmpR family regulator